MLNKINAIVKGISGPPPSVNEVIGIQSIDLGANAVSSVRVSVSQEQLHGHMLIVGAGHGAAGRLLTNVMRQHIHNGGGMLLIVSRAHDVCFDAMMNAAVQAGRTDEVLVLNNQLAGEKQNYAHMRETNTLCCVRFDDTCMESSVANRHSTLKHYISDMLKNRERMTTLMAAADPGSRTFMIVIPEAGGVVDESTTWSIFRAFGHAVVVQVRARLDFDRKRDREQDFVEANMETVVDFTGSAEDVAVVSQRKRVVESDRTEYGHVFQVVNTSVC